jgi:hypothetical protein
MYIRFHSMIICSTIKILIETCYLVTGLHLSDILFNTFIPRLYPIFKAFPTNAISMSRGRKIICLFVTTFTSFCHSLSHSSSHASQDSRQIHLYLLEMSKVCIVPLFSKKAVAALFHHDIQSLSNDNLYLVCICDCLHWYSEINLQLHELLED